jgi:hypothetical protein
MTVVVDHVGKFATTLTGRRWRVRGEVAPYVADQQVTVRFFRDGKKFLAKRAAVKPGASGKAGHFKLSLSTKVSGRVTVRVTKEASATQVAIKVPAQRVLVLPDHVTPGTRSNAVRILQRRLKALGYVPGHRGTYDARTARAVLAFRKVSGLARTSTADRAVMRRMANGGGHFRIRYPSHGKHVEADLSRQVLALIVGGRVERIYHTSTGAPATPTILGSYRVYRKDLGTNAKGMVHSSYFIRGYAVHGYPSVPVYPASHGCLRVPLADALSIYNWLRYGDRVDVYR